MSYKSCLVLGASGQVGKALLNILCSHGIPNIIATSRDPVKQEGPKGVKWVKVDLTSKQSLRPYIKQAEVVFSTFGTDNKKNVTIYSKAYPQIITCMDEQKKQKLIAVTACFKHPQYGWIMSKFLNFMLGEINEDMERASVWIRKFISDNAKKEAPAITVFKPFRLMKMKESDRGVKIAESETKASTGFTFQTDIVDLAEQMFIQSRENRYPNMMLDIGKPKS